MASVAWLVDEANLRPRRFALLLALEVANLGCLLAFTVTETCLNAITKLATFPANVSLLPIFISTRDVTTFYLASMSSPAPAAAPADSQHSSRLSTTRSHLAYLANPKNSPAPKSLVTRSSLKTFRYVLKFVFWRLLRYAVRPEPLAASLSSS